MDIRAPRQRPRPDLGPDFWDGDASAHADPLAAAHAVASVDPGDVPPLAAYDAVARAIACEERVVSGAAVEQIAPGAAIKQVRVSVAEEPVMAPAAEEPVPAARGRRRAGAPSRACPLPAAVAEQGVVAPKSMNHVPTPPGRR
jgi:hypothetical protein